MRHHISATLLTGITALLASLNLSAQPGRTVLIAPNIRTLQLMVDGDAGRLPVIGLGEREQLQVSFDDLTPEYRRYTYRIEHCDSEGNPSEGLFENDYVQAVAEEEVIEDYEPSRNTTVLYTHYSFALPNANLRPLLSGNYLLTVSTENEEGESVPVIKTYFGVADRKVGIAPQCTTDTDTDRNRAHQQLSLKIDFGNLTLRDAAREVRTVILQNRRYDNAVINAPHTAQNGNVLLWEHDRDLIFKAGNEYRKMEILSTRYPGMHGDHVRWFAPFYHYTLLEDYPRKNYLYDEDHDGLYLTRWAGSGDPDVEADYLQVHFTLSMLPETGREIYVNGRWASGGLTPEYRMRYDEDAEAYVADILLKAGYYNYMYLCTDGTAPAAGQTAPVEGDYFQTENEYTILVYYCPTGSRYWQLVGAVTPVYKE